eukprot:5493184-Prorocentrum_lima.AAC.1
MLPQSPYDTLAAAGVGPPVDQPLPRTPKDAAPFLDLSRPVPRTPVDKSTAIPKTPWAPWAATGIAASAQETQGGRVPAPATPKRASSTPPTSWSDWAVSPPPPSVPPPDTKP